jgi:hypothetical protein
MVVTSSNAWRSNARWAGRPLEDLPHGHRLALHRTRRPSRTGGSVQAGVEEGDGNQLCDLDHTTQTLLFYSGLRAMAQSAQSLAIGI